MNAARALIAIVEHEHLGPVRGRGLNGRGRPPSVPPSRSGRTPTGRPAPCLPASRKWGLVTAELGQPALDGQKPAVDDTRHWSVTTIIGALDKPAPLYWAAEQTALAAVASAKVPPARIDEEGAAEGRQVAP